MPKDYLFQTNIDIANDQDVKHLLEQYENDLLKVYIDISVYRKILFRNPRLISSSIFTKPIITQRYLNYAYSQGIKIKEILGKDISFEIFESIKFTDIEVFDEFNKIINNNEKLFDKLALLNDNNMVLNLNNYWEDYPIICTILYLIWLYELFTSSIILILSEIFEENQIIFKILDRSGERKYYIGLICTLLLLELECVYYPYYS